jgi:hypothetical protein
VLIFGLTDADRIEKLEVFWPSGTRQSFTELAVDAEILLVEGAVRPYDLPRR